MRNNEERLGVMPQSESFAPVAAASTTANSGFDFAVPEQIVDLPSKGRFYAEGHPLYNKETATIRFMTAADEDILTNKSYLKKGVVIDKLLQHVLVDKSIDVGSLLIGDKNALIVAARITGYGAKYDTSLHCPSCFEKVSFCFDLETRYEEDEEKKQKALENVRTTPNNTFIVHLPLMKVDIECRLLTGKDERRLLEQAEMRKKANLEETTLTDQFRLIVVSANGRTDSMTLDKVITNMPASDSRYFRDIYDKLNPSYDLRQMFKCSHCDVQMEVAVPLTADFFWSR